MTIEVTMLVAVVSAIIGYMGYALNRDRDRKNENQHDAKLEAKLEYISKGVDDIRIDIKSNEKQLALQAERLTRVEESSKQAHKRLDKMEGKLDEN